METTETLAMAADNPHFPAWLRTACKEGAAEIERRFGIGGELLIARRERDELREQIEMVRADFIAEVERLRAEIDRYTPPPAWVGCEA